MNKCLAPFQTIEFNTWLRITYVVFYSPSLQQDWVICEQTPHRVDKRCYIEQTATLGWVYALPLTCCVILDKVMYPFGSCFTYIMTINITTTTTTYLPCRVLLWKFTQSILFTTLKHIRCQQLDHYRCSLESFRTFTPLILPWFLTFYRCPHLPPYLTWFLILHHNHAFASFSTPFI